MSHLKVSFVGSAGAGKTTAISVLCNNPLVWADTAVTDLLTRRNIKTTAVMDYGLLDIGKDRRIQLHGTLGQECSDFAWEMFGPHSTALVLLVNNARSTPFHDMHFFLDSFKDYVKNNRLIIGVTHTDQESRPTLAQYQNELLKWGINTPVINVDARKKEELLSLLSILFDTSNTKPLGSVHSD